MNFGIIAAGEGSRLMQEGSDVPKPLVELDGMPMIGRLIRIFIESGADSINVVVNPAMPEVVAYLEDLKKNINVDLKFMVKSTPSSMHTLGELIKLAGDDDKIIVTTVDTVFKEEKFRRYAEKFAVTGEDIDALMGITDYIEDEKPLYISVASDDDIISFDDLPSAEVKYISAGIYGLGPRCFPVLRNALENGVHRMRNYQRELIAEGLKVKAFDIGKVIDVDHVSDISRARLLIAEKSF